MLRNLKTKDIFAMSKILKKLNLKKELKITEKVKIGDEEKTIKKTQEQLGAELILNVIENIHMAENEVTEFLADLAGKSKEEFADLDIDKLMEIVEEFKNIPGIANFLKRANQLTN